MLPPILLIRGGQPNSFTSHFAAFRGLSQQRALLAAKGGEKASSEGREVISKSKHHGEVGNEVTSDLRAWRTFTLANGSIVAWHPKRQFPYEHSRPIDLAKAMEEKERFYASLKLRVVGQEYVRPPRSALYPTRGPRTIDLREIFYTDMQEWTPSASGASKQEGKRMMGVLATDMTASNDMTIDHIVPSTQSNSIIRALWLRQRIPYLDGLRMQECIFEAMKAAEGGDETTHKQNIHYLCLFEHHPVYTVGVRGQLYPAEEEERLKALGAEFHRVKRGGLITFHGPGQLVGYPLFNLSSLNSNTAEELPQTAYNNAGSAHPNPTPSSPSMGVNRFVKLVEEVLIRCMVRRFGVWGTGRTENPGVWVAESRKIAALGMQIRGGITSHGFALNCNTNLEWFRNIVPCGLEGKMATSLTKELERQITIEDVVEPICECFESVFGVPVELHSFGTTGGVEEVLKSHDFKRLLVQGEHST